MYCQTRQIKFDDARPTESVDDNVEQLADLSLEAERLWLSRHGGGGCIEMSAYKYSACWCMMVFKSIKLTSVCR